MNAPVVLVIDDEPQIRRVVRNAVEPGMGAVAFCGVVILTMFAAETFDPRLMWDAAERAEATRAGVAPATVRL